MRAGKLNRKIIVQYRARDFDAAGQLKEGWQDLCIMWAWVKSQSGVAATPTADGVGRDITRYSFRVRYNTRIKADMRIIYQGDIFEIREVLHDIAGHEYTDLLAYCGGANG